MNFIIHQAEAPDAADIARVQVESWRATYAGIVPADYLASLSIETQTGMWSAIFAGADPPLIVVAEDATGIFGFAAGGPIREALPGYDAELYTIYLVPHRKRQGAGRALCRTVAAGLRDRGFKSMAVWALEVNPSTAFYERLGAVRIAQKLTDIGGAALSDLAFGWPSWDRLLQDAPTDAFEDPCSL